MTFPFPVLLQLTDRSRYETGHRCKREELLTYHWGPHGYGINRAAQKIPLATGDVVHRGLAFILHWVREHDQLPPLPVVNGGVLHALNAYTEIVASRGLQHWDVDELAQQRLIVEQRLLTEGLIRAWTLWQLPEVLRDWKIEYVEYEAVTVVACTCGLGDRVGSWLDHVAQSCEGIGIQSRGDFLAQHRVSRAAWAYHEFKTTGKADKRFEDTYETTMQPHLGTIAAEDALGIEVEQIFIHGLLKGERDHEYDPALKDYSGPEYQNSRLVYAYYSDAEQQWAVRYKWTDELGVGRKLPGHYKKQPLSTLLAQGVDYQQFLETFAPDLKDKVLRTIGPLPRKDYLRSGALTSWTASELTKRQGLHAFVDLVEAHDGDWAHPEVQELLDVWFPRSFDCMRFGARYQCQMIPICHQHPGWQDPFSLGYVPRRPHHQPELDQAVSRGLIAPAVATEGDDE